MEEYLKLVDTLRYHMNRYYNEDAPEISDYEYDALMTRLKDLEAEHPDWVRPDSPSQIVGGRPESQSGKKVVHRVPMLSIEDVFTKDSVCEWVNKVQALYPDAAFSVEHKIDGLSMTLRYSKSGENTMSLTLAETRGNGYEGDDCTPNARMIPEVPQNLALPYDYLEIRGEVYMNHAAFEAFNYAQEQAGKKPAANPRNLAAGTLRLLDAELTRKRGLSFFAFNVQDGPRDLMRSHCEALDILSSAGIPCVPRFLCHSAADVCEAIDTIGDNRENYSYDIDGAVVKLDDIPHRQEFTSGSKYSTGHIAYKYPPEERLVVMDDILVDVGRTGKLTFTGVFHDPETGKPARLCGTSVSRATLHNQDYITSMKIGIGGSYMVYKSGEIIPRLNGCVKDPPMIFRAPDLCPVCSGKLIREEDTADIRCVNPFCRAQLSRTISYFSSLNCMKIDALGEKLIDALIQEGYLSGYADIYTLKEKREELIEKGVIGKAKNTDRILASIEESKKNDPVRLLTALGIRNVGLSTARELMKHFRTITELAGASVQQLVEIPDIGETTALCICDFFSNEVNRTALSALADAGVNMTMPAVAEGSERLKGLSIVITGTLPTLGRKEIEELIVSNGGKASSSVSKKTSYVIAGEAAGSKLTKAHELGIPILTESGFLAMLNEKERG